MYQKSIKEVLKELNTSTSGLTTKQITRRRKEFGVNKIENKNKSTKLTIFFNQFDNLMIKLLLIVAVISGIYAYMTHESLTDTILIVVIVLLNVFMGYFQEEKAEASIASLQKVERLTCKVRRDGKDIIINVEHLLPGDILYLEAGDKIPADGRIIECTNLSVNESLLTGESEAVLKDNNVIKKDVLINDRYNMVYSGCDVVNGKGLVVVTDIGLKTELGKIANSLTEKKDFPTPLQKKITEISESLTKIITVVIVFVVIYNIFVLKNSLISVIMLAISLMVSAVPEGLPAVITISLSIGVNALAKKRTIARTLSSVETLGNVEVICSDKTGTITQNKMTVTKLFRDDKLYDSSKYEYRKNDLLIKAMMLANDTSYINKKFVGDPTEVALIDICVNNKISYESMITNNRRCGDIPFDSTRKMMSSLYTNGRALTLYSKGSLESILSKCKYYLCDGEVINLTKKKKDELFDIEKSLSSNALRVLAFAYKNTPDLDENDLVFVGMVGMIDPPRPTVKDAIKTCRTSGIIPIMITGDNLTTAMEIARRVGLADEDSVGIEGKDIAKLSDLELTHQVLNYSVYARVSPEDKVRIVTALQHNNKVVAMTGDGVNDAPAIKLADIGIGMGKTGTEVTKSTADILLLDDSFSTIVDANYEGRRIFDNIRNVIIYSLSSNFAEIFIVVAGMFLSVTALLPIHILYIDLVTDAALSICLAFEKASDNIMKRPPRKSTSKFFTPWVTASLVFSSFLEGLIVFICFVYGLNYGLAVAQTMALLCLIIQETLYAINCRNLKEPIYKQGFFSNKYFNIGLTLIIIIQVLTFITPARSLLHIVMLDFNQIAFVFITNFIIFILVEISKVVINKYFIDE
ncbi:MAG: cation-translocating P-type ATPase [Firmicutes bacterium]|nr:cation-translocating P-type ATPase [Bacillota bacterium]